jgi:3-phosphoshikimate 1-carboxyvinyltransferase
MTHPFRFVGALPPSKSLVIRSLLLQSYEPRIRIPVLSRCADVQAMAAAGPPLRSDAAEVAVRCGEAGLVLRLCLARASRRAGVTRLVGSPRLLSRPHAELVQALGPLGAQIESDPAGSALIVRAPAGGWRDPGHPIALSASTSSQFASALLLNAWELPFALSLHIGRDPVSQGYLQMSLRMARRFGMQIDDDGDGLLRIPPAQTLLAGEAESEADVSSAFAVAALAAVAGTAQIANFPQHSQQPDAAFVDLLRAMGVPVALDAAGLYVARAEAPLRPLRADVAGCPDLVPVLSVLCALADGESLLFGAPHLRAKESDRIATSAALLRCLGREVEERSDGLRIHGRPLSASDASAPLRFDAGRDHRLVMAAAVARHAGFPLLIDSLDAVDKSFPEFLDIAGLV